LGGLDETVLSEVDDKIRRLFRHAQVGTCVSGVAHDVNNLLGAIMAYAELVGLDQGLSPDSVRMLEEISGAATKCSALMNNLTDIARRERPDVRVVSPQELVDRAVALRRYDIKTARIELDVKGADNLPSVAVDLPKLERALMQLLANVIEAVADAEDRRLRITLGESASGVEIVFWNSGPPVNEGDRDRIFDPFFTTKGDEHLGLGLTIARETLCGQDGDLVYEPTRGFVVTLPRSKSESID
jgi:two-component system NtrC family sensor kinase